VRVTGKFGVCMRGERKKRDKSNLLFNFLDEQFLSRFTAKLPWPKSCSSALLLSNLWPVMVMFVIITMAYESFGQTNQPHPMNCNTRTR